LNHDGRLLACQDRYGRGFLFDVQKGEFLAILTVAEKKPEIQGISSKKELVSMASMSFSPDSRTIALGTQEGGILLWRPKVLNDSNNERAKIKSSKSAPSRQINEPIVKPKEQPLTISQNASPIADARQTTFSRTIPETPQYAVAQTGETPQDAYGDPLPKGAIARLGTLRFRHDNPINSLAISPDGRSAAAVTFSQNMQNMRYMTRTKDNPSVLSIWDTGTGKLRWTTQDAGMTAAFSPDGKTVATPHGLLDVRTGNELNKFNDRLMRDGSKIGFAPEGKLISVGAMGGIVWDVEKNTQVSSVSFNQQSAEYVGLSPDGNYFAASIDRKPRLWDARTGKERPLKAGGPSGRLAFSPDGHILAVSDPTIEYGNYFNMIHYWDVSSGDYLYSLKPFSVNYRPSAFTFAPDNKLLTASYDNESVFVFDYHRNTIFRKLPVYAQELVYFTDSYSLAAVENQSITFWDTASGKEIGPVRGHSGAVNALAFSKEGNVVISCGCDRGLRFWDLISGKQIMQLQWPSEYSRKSIRCAISPDAQYLAVIGERSLYVMEISTGKILMADSYGQYRMIAFSPDSKSLICVKMNGPNSNIIESKSISTGLSTTLIKISQPGFPCAVLAGNGNLFICGATYVLVQREMETSIG
jgi:WD40 repeat protein